MVLSLQQKAAEYLEAFLAKKNRGKFNTKSAILLYTSDRGLCGALNSGLCKKLELFVAEKQTCTLYILLLKNSVLGFGFFPFWNFLF